MSAAWQLINGIPATATTHRPPHSSKSSVAAAAAQRINPGLAVTPLQNRVSPDTESVFDDKFWQVGVAGVWGEGWGLQWDGQPEKVTQITYEDLHLQQVAMPALRQPMRMGLTCPSLPSLLFTFPPVNLPGSGPGCERAGQRERAPVRGQPLCLLRQAAAGEWHAGAQVQHADGVCVCVEGGGCWVGGRMRRSWRSVCVGGGD